jgi:hypothetical protein
VTDYMTDPSKPIEVSDLEVAFGANVRHLMPAWDDIPEEFKRHVMRETPGDRASKYLRLVGDWFFVGIEGLRFDLKDDIDGGRVMRHIQTVLGSWEPKHEHKEAAVAYLLSLWTNDVKWKRRERTPT